ncbi:transposon TX1 [Tanacetum coccineum]
MFSNFPDVWGMGNLWMIFKKYGTVFDMFMVQKRLRNGQRYGFVRFKFVTDVENLLMRLRKIRVGEECMRVTDIHKKTKTRQKPDKTEHGIGKSVENQSQRREKKTFCSIECRSMQIAQMEEESIKKKTMMRNKHDCGSSTSYTPQQVPVSRSSGHGHGQMCWIVCPSS